MDEQTNEQTTNEQNSKIPDWIQEENDKLDQGSSYDGEKLPSLQFEEGKIVKFTVDFTNKFMEYDDQANKCLKAIIPVTHKDEKKILWLNKKNPLYKDLVHKGGEGQTEFKVSQTGKLAQTKYSLVEEED